MRTTRVTAKQQKAALKIVAAWLGPRMGYDGPAPTGDAAAYAGDGPRLDPKWDWPNAGPTPTILLEGADDWAVEIGGSTTVTRQMRDIGVWTEPYAAYALCLYPTDE